MASGNQNNMQNGDREFPYEIVDIDDDMFKKACSYIHGKFFFKSFGLYGVSLQKKNCKDQDVFFIIIIVNLAKTFNII